MNALEQYIVTILQGYLTWNSQPVQVVKQFSQHPERPVVTLDIQSVTTQHVYLNPGVAERYYERKANININLWCDTEEQRESLTGKILDCFYKEQGYHYRYCQNLRNGRCTTTSTSCPAVNTHHKRCTDPERLGYSSLRHRCGLITGTVMVDPPFELDELTEHPPLLRSVFRCEGQYSDTVGDLAPIETVTSQTSETADGEGVIHLGVEEDEDEDEEIP